MCRDLLAQLFADVRDALRAVLPTSQTNEDRGVSATLSWGVPSPRREEDRVADVTLHDDEEVTVTVAWTDERGRPTAPPAGGSPTSSDPAVAVRDTGDGVHFVVSATGVATGSDVSVSFGGEGVTNPPTATVRVIRWPAVGGSVSWDEPRPVSGDGGDEGGGDGGDGGGEQAGWGHG